MTKTDICKNCAWFDSVDDEPDGICRRHPPVVTSGLWGDTKWPQVDDNDWCGEFKNESR